MTTDHRSLFDLSWRAIAKVVIAAALVWAWLQVWQLFLVIILAIVIAVALNPAVRWLEHRRMSRGAGAFAVVLLLTAVILVLIAVGWVTLQDQSRVIAQRLTESIQQVRATFPVVEYLMPSGNNGGTAGLAAYVPRLVRSAATAAGMIVLALALTVYLLIEWKTTLEWCMAFVPERHRTKVHRTLEEAREIVYRYAIGNLIASAITGMVTFLVLAWLEVPAALMLALISGVLNFIPVLGFIVSSVVAAVVAATVSTNVLLLVIAFFLAFNVIENYLITPKVFGYEMELSDLAVLIAVIVGAELGGVMGALLALPIAAIYPTIERIWLRERLGSDTVDIHKRLSA